MAEIEGATPAPVIEQPISEPVVEPQVQQPVLPTETRDRTREQFEKLIESNRRLYERNLQLETQYAKAKPVQPAQVDPKDFARIDPNTGERYIDEDKLRNRFAELEAANQKVQQLEKQVESFMQSSQEQEIDRQTRETYSAYPELNPQSKTFDPNFNRYVRGILIDAFNNQAEYGGRPLSFKEAADYVKKQFGQPVAPSTDHKVSEQAQQAQVAKEQASTQVQSQPQNQKNITDDQELEALRYRTRYHNDDNALAQRIAHTEHIIPKS